MKDVDLYAALSMNQVQEIYASKGGSRMQLVRFVTQGDPVPEVVYDEADCRGNHVQYISIDTNILHTSRDFAPNFWSGSDQVRNRVWLWHIDEKRLVEQPSPSGRTFQVHSVWSFDGEGVLYHCSPSRTDPGGYVIGINDLDGNINHDLILWLRYHDPATPRIEMVCRHDTDWGGHEGQYSHPHPQCAPTGDTVTYLSSRCE